MFAWSRTFYAMKNGICYNFEAKRDRDTAVREHGFVSIAAADAYKRYPHKKVFYSRNIPIDWRKFE